MVRPLYRWKSLWFGVLVVTFLGWAWVRSRAVSDFFQWMGNQISILGTQESGIVTLRIYAGIHARQWGPALSTNWQSSPYPGRWKAGKFHDAASQPWIPEVSFRVVDTKEIDGGHEVTLAHWFLILGFLVPWAGFLVWRVRRVKRLAGAVPADRN